VSRRRRAPTKPSAFLEKPSVFVDSASRFLRKQRASRRDEGVSLVNLRVVADQESMFLVQQPVNLTEQ
jgi:hypothetical protein